METRMDERTLLASVVLFGELYDSDKDIYDVIAEFIKATMIFENKWAFNTTEATQLLSSVFGLSIPEAVISTTLRNRLLKRDHLLSNNNGVYSLADERLKKSHSINQEFESLKKKQNDILESLYSYVECKEGNLTDEDKIKLAKCFSDYLFGNEPLKKYTNYVSYFIIQNQNNSDLTASLNAVREGFVMYNAVRYTPNINDLDSWKKKLVIFLDTEYLFGATGFNGTLYEQLFKDLYNLINEVRQKGERLITLRYFNESENEIDKFFYVAECIVDGKASIDPSKTAMLSIIDGCHYRSDVIAKKALFYSRLNSYGITNGESLISNIDFQYNIEGGGLYSKIEQEIKEKGFSYNEEKCANALRMFTKINFLRKGENSKAFEEIGYILVSGSSFTRFLAFHSLIKNNSFDIPYATDLDFITNRLWFRLRKGLARQLSTPQSLNIIAKAQVVLSSQINNCIASKFDKIQADYNCGKLDKTEAQYLSNELRTKTSTPESLTPEEISPTIDFLSQEGYEYHLREKSALLEKVREGEYAKIELEKINAEKKQKKEYRILIKSYLRLSAFALLLIVCIIGIYYYSFLLMVEYSNGKDSPLTILGIMLTILLGTFPLIKFKSIFLWFRRQHDRFIADEFKKLVL